MGSTPAGVFRARVIVYSIILSASANPFSTLPNSARSVRTVFGSLAFGFMNFTSGMIFGASGLSDSSMFRMNGRSSHSIFRSRSARSHISSVSATTTTPIGCWIEFGGSGQGQQVVVAAIPQSRAASRCRIRCPDHRILSMSRTPTRASALLVSMLLIRACA